MTNDNDTTFQELAEAVQEIDRLKAEVKQLRGCLPSIDTYKLAMDERSHFAQECERLKAENAILRRSQAGQSILIQQAPHAMECNLEQDAPFDGVQCNCWKSKWDMSVLKATLAPTVNLLREGADTAQAAQAEVGIGVSRLQYRIELEKRLRAERARLTALMEGKA